MNWLKASLIIFLALFVFGCAQQQTPAPSAATSVAPSLAPSVAVSAAPSVAAGVENGAGAAGEVGLQFENWTAPDGSITLQKPVGWTATEWQVDACTVDWTVTNPSGASQAFMNNQILVFKSEAARQMYEQYGLTGAGIDAAPVSGFLGAEQAVTQVVAPLSGSSNAQIVGRDAALTRQFSQAVCAAGLAACDAQVFEATYLHAGVPMRGEYLAQSFDFGDGGTWWINLWGYTSPAAEWNASRGALEKTFASVRYTDAWKEKCSNNAAETSGVVNEVVRNRQAASDKAAEEWDEYILGG